MGYEAFALKTKRGPRAPGEGDTPSPSGGLPYDGLTRRIAPHIREFIKESNILSKLLILGSF